MSSDNKREKTGLIPDLKNYTDLRIEELKLKATRGLSVGFASLLSALLIIAVLCIVLSLLAYAGLQWLNSILGAPWGTLSVCGVFIVLLIILLLSAGKMFRNTFVKLFIEVFFGSKDE